MPRQEIGYATYLLFGVERPETGGFPPGFEGSRGDGTVCCGDNGLACLPVGNCTTGAQRFLTALSHRSHLLDVVSATAALVPQPPYLPQSDPSAGLSPPGHPARAIWMIAADVKQWNSVGVYETLGEVPMGKDDPRSSPGFDRWLKANVVVGSVLSIGMLAMALAGLYSPPPDRATEVSSIARK